MAHSSSRWADFRWSLGWNIPLRGDHCPKMNIVSSVEIWSLKNLKNRNCLRSPSQEAAPGFHLGLSSHGWPESISISYRPMQAHKYSWWLISNLVISLYAYIFFHSLNVLESLLSYDGLTHLCINQENWWTKQQSHYWLIPRHFWPRNKSINFISCQDSFLLREQLTTFMPSQNLFQTISLTPCNTTAQDRAPWDLRNE